jgi:hypothetical protein
VLSLVVHAGDEVDLPSALAEAAEATGARLRKLQVDPVSLADVFLATTGRELRE